MRKFIGAFIRIKDGIFSRQSFSFEGLKLLRLAFNATGFEASDSRELLRIGGRSVETERDKLKGRPSEQRRCWMTVVSFDDGLKLENFGEPLVGVTSVREEQGKKLSRPPLRDDDHPRAFAIEQLSKCWHEEADWR